MIKTRIKKKSGVEEAYLLNTIEKKEAEGTNSFLVIIPLLFPITAFFFLGQVVLMVNRMEDFLLSIKINDPGSGTESQDII